MIRTYLPADAAKTLALFTAAVIETAAADYTSAQVNAWAQPGTRDPEVWNAGMLARNSFIAEVDGEPAGFSDVSHTGFIDMMIVAPTFQRQGIASRLLAFAESQARDAGATELTANVSLTARPFFEQSGFVIEAEQQVEIKGTHLTNFKMRKPL